MTGSSGPKSGIESATGALSAAAKRVVPYLEEITEAAGEAIEELQKSFRDLMNETTDMLYKARKVFSEAIKKGVSEADAKMEALKLIDFGKIIDVKLVAAQKESELLIAEVQEGTNQKERETVIANFFRKSIDNLHLEDWKASTPVAEEKPPQTLVG